MSFNRTFADKVVGFFSPKADLERMGYRAKAQMLETGFPIPGSKNRVMRGWNPSANLVDTDTLESLEKIRAGSRDLFMNTPVATAILNRLKNKVIGFGLQLQSRIDHDLLGISEEEAAKWQRSTEREFRLWAESPECDAARTLNFYDMQALAYLSALMSGDVFVALPYIERKDSDIPYDLRIKLIEADFVSNPVKNGIPTYGFSGGVETDGHGAPKAYHVRQLPLNLPVFGGFGDSNSMIGTWTRIPAFGTESGRRNILHLFTKERPGQRRGIPLLAPVMDKLKQATRLTDSELMAALISSMFTVFLTNEQNTVGFADIFSSSERITDPNSVEDKNQIELGHGAVVELGKGQKIEMADPKRPNGAFDPFLTAILKQTCAACNIPYELVQLHFAASYSATRGAIIEAVQHIKDRQIWTARNLCNPVYKEWMFEAVLKGRVSAPGFLEDPAARAAWLGAKWSGPGQGQIDPFKETQAAKLAVESHFSTYEDEYQARGGSDWDSRTRRAASEKALLKELDLFVEPKPPELPGAAGDEGDNGDAPPKKKKTKGDEE